MKRAEAIEILLAATGDALRVFANGYISREAHHHDNSDRNFYMIGSMGMASAIGLGLAKSWPQQTVCVFDGDGNILSNLGCLAMVGEMQPANYIHIALDNHCYESTGGQRCISDHILLSSFAKAAGYAEVRETNSTEDLRQQIRTLYNSKGPSFLHVRVDAGRLVDAGRVSIAPDELTERFSNAVKAQQGRGNGLQTKNG